MPLYEYTPDSGRCAECGGRFEVLQSLSEPALSECPTCHEPCHRVMSGFATGKAESNLLSSRSLEQKGFTRYEKTGDGQYVKTLGDGPSRISGGGDE